MKRYEGQFILNNNLTSTGKDDGVTVALERISKDIEAAGGKIEATQKMDKRNFSRVADKKYSSGFYVNIIFQSPGSAIATLQHKFGLNFTRQANPLLRGTRAIHAKSAGLE